MNRSLDVALLCTAIVVATARDSHAYIDPGAGSLLLQVVLGGAAALAVLTRRYWATLKSRLGRRTAVAPRDRPQ